ALPEGRQRGIVEDPQFFAHADRVAERLGPAIQDFAARAEASRGWPTGACPRAGCRPDPWAGHDGGHQTVWASTAPYSTISCSLSDPPSPSSSGFGSA